MITTETIRKCFKKAGFNQEGHEDSVDDLDVIPENAVPPNIAASFREVADRWDEVQNAFGSSVTFEDFVNADNATPVHEVQELDKIIADMRNRSENEDKVKLRRPSNDIKLFKILSFVLIALFLCSYRAVVMKRERKRMA